MLAQSLTQLRLSRRDLCTDVLDVLEVLDVLAKANL